VNEVLCLRSVAIAFDRGRDRVVALQDISLSVGEGEIVSVIAGPSQGKTTLLRIASGLLPPDHGVVSVGGVTMTGLRDRQRQRILARDIGLAMGSGPATMRSSVREYVELKAAAPKNGSLRLFSRQERRHMTRAVLDQLEIGDCADMRWQDISDWQRTLVELAQAMVVSPRLLLIDDLGCAFGLRQKQTIMAFLEDFVQTQRSGVLMAVSDDDSALRSVRIWRLNRRRLTLLANDTAGDLDPQADVIPMRRADAGGGAGW